MSSKQGIHVKKVPKDGKESLDRISGVTSRARGGQTRVPISTLQNGKPLNSRGIG